MFLGVTPTILRPSLLSAILKPQDVFATSLYTGTGSDQDVVSGVDLLTRGGMLWDKSRNNTFDHIITRTDRLDYGLAANRTDAEFGPGVSPRAYKQNGFTAYRNSGDSRVAWSFARAAKFFDIVTWTGDGTSNRLIPHGLGVVPGMVAHKRRDAVGPWWVYHRSTTVSQTLLLNTTDAAFSGSLYGVSEPTSTTFTVNGTINIAGQTYVAYLFAHDPSADGIVQCGGGVSSGGVITINHGWAGGAQWVMLKRSDAADNWKVYDTARTPSFAGTQDRGLYPNTSNAELFNDGVDEAAQSGGTFTSNVGVNGASFIWAIIRAPY